MTAKTEMKILNLYKGLTIAQAARRLSIMNKHLAHKKLDLRLRLAR